jgi:hypothetical protein
MLQKREGFRVPASGIYALLQQGAEDEAVIPYCNPSVTRVADPVKDRDLKPFRFPEGFHILQPEINFSSQNKSAVEYQKGEWRCHVLGLIHFIFCTSAISDNTGPIE